MSEQRFKEMGTTIKLVLPCALGVAIVFFLGISVSGLADAADGEAEKIEFEGKEFRVVKIDPAKQKLELMWMAKTASH